MIQLNKFEKLPEFDPMSVISLPDIEIKNFISKVEVESKLVKQAFLEMQILLRKSAYVRIVEISKQEDMLWLRTNTSVIYERIIPVLSEESDNFTVCCLFEDLGELIPGRGRLTVSAAPGFVEFSSEETNTTLNISNDSIPKSPKIEGEQTTLITSRVREGIRHLSSLTAISNVFKTGNQLLFSGDIVQVRYPTIWIQSVSSSLHTVLDISSSVMVEKFLSTAISSTLVDSDSYIVISKEGANLYLPIPATD